MTTKGEIQALLRFLSHDAKVPLPVAMAKIKELQKAQLGSIDALSNSDRTAMQAIFENEKTAKQVLSAAKRVAKKKTNGETPAKSLVIYKKRTQAGEQLSPAAMEESLALPSSTFDESELTNVLLHTNRAPLVLAFAVTLLKYTMPGQPLSSRLSLAQAITSANAKSKAVSLGIKKSIGAEDEGWGQGQPAIRVMGREIRVMKRWGYDPESVSGAAETGGEEIKVMGSQATFKHDGNAYTEPALWGLDLEALRRSNGPLVPGVQSAHGSGLPIYNAQSARTYLLRSFASPASLNAGLPPRKKPAATLQAEKEQNLAKLLQALDMLHESWAHVLSHTDLDRRAWAWYVAVRPEVQSGVAGWGGKGEVKLSQILDMRRKGNQSSVTATQHSEVPDPTQDVGFGASSPTSGPFTSSPPSTVDTVLLSGRPHW